MNEASTMDVESEQQVHRTSAAEEAPVGRAAEKQPSTHRRRADDQPVDESANPPQPSNISHWPMLRASMGAAILTLVIQCGSAAWIALQSGHQVSLGRWAVFPYLQISTTSVRDFSDIVFWSSVVSALVLSLYAISALIRFRPLQTQMGRSFAFLDISLIGFLAMTSALWFDRRQVYSDWMLHLFLGGGIAFIVAAWIVRDRYRDREALRAQKQHSHASAET